MTINYNNRIYHILGNLSLICYEHLTVFQVLTDSYDTLFLAIPDNYIVLERCAEPNLYVEVYVSDSFERLVSLFEDRGRYEYSKYLLFQ